MTPGRRPAIFTIPPSLPFLDALAAGLLVRHGDDPLALSAVTVLLPTRRAVLALRDAFLRASGRPLLLPAMRPVGDVEEEAFELVSLAAEDELDLPPAIPALSRQLLLTRMILARGDATDEPALAARLAAELARLLDQVHTERLGFDALAELVPAGYAAHWQTTLDFLKLATEHWPQILAEQGLLDPAARRDRLIAAQAARWRAAPPADPVYLAGSTGSLPATADLMRVVAGLAQGGVVLPGLDTGLDDDGWAAVGQTETHPQFGMHQLLARLEVDRTEVRSWQETGSGNASRVALISEAQRPAATTDRWRALAQPAATATEGFGRIDCADQQEEAGVIALALRQALETPGRTAALVTPDRALARRVATELRRWRVEIDDSAGLPLAHTPPGTFLLLTAAMAAEALAPVALLAALKHPFAAGGLPPGEFRARLRELERLALRGPRPAPGAAGLRAALAAADAPPALCDWLDGLLEAAAPFLDLASAAETDLAELIAVHVAFAEWLGAELWAGEAGEQAALFVAELAQAAAVMGPIRGAAWPALLESLMAGQTVRPAAPPHPRLHIWGPLEARLQRADLVILGGLNDGTWPPDARTDPWLSRPMRAEFGLPQPERRIGLAAHDFAQLAAAPEVLLTRATKVEGTPTVPSRWLLRLDSLLGGAGLTLESAAGQAYLDWQRQLDATAAAVPVPPPRPCPPVDARPRRLSVTQIETLIRDPYAIYARHVLGLRPLPAVAADPGAAERGTIIHQALERFVAGLDGGWPADAEARLIDAGREAFAEVIDRPAVRAFWWPRFLRAVRWFLDWEAPRRAEIRRSLVEVDGRLDLMPTDRSFGLTAKADRIDVMADGSLAILDYKTGQLPSDRQVESGLSPQLPLEAAMAMAGGFDGLGAASVGSLVYLQLGGGEPPGAARALKAAPDALAAETQASLVQLIAEYGDVATPYLSRPRPVWASRFGDYDHLARVKEWSAAGGGEP